MEREVVLFSEDNWAIKRSGEVVVVSCQDPLRLEVTRHVGSGNTYTGNGI